MKHAILTLLITKRRKAGQASFPFVGQNMPFVGWRHRSIRPFISKNRPFVMFRMNSGFSMIELLVTLVIVAIISALAYPSFRSTLQNSQLVSQTNQLIGDLNFARSEAIKRGLPVALCPAASTSACAASTSWSTGRLIWVDTDSNDALDNTDTILRRREPTSGTGTLVRTACGGCGDIISFNNRGAVNSTTEVTFASCDERGAGAGKELKIASLGRVESSGKPASCS
ncbi:MAG: hypothetical protein BMS9Abin33_0901 [Gammaproteobacteria bacterium]|nr:MAG: hypothetical protein BMS9Abin33_0901 [Gammaproteobacteria bacterium]